MFTELRLCLIRFCLTDGPVQADRNAALAHLNELQAELSKLQAELNAYGQCNPEQAEIKRRAIVLAREAALRWTGESSQSFDDSTRDM